VELGGARANLEKKPASQGTLPAPTVQWAGKRRRCVKKKNFTRKEKKPPPCGGRKRKRGNYIELRPRSFGHKRGEVLVEKAV